MKATARGSKPQDLKVRIYCQPKTFPQSKVLELVEDRNLALVIAPGLPDGDADVGYVSGLQQHVADSAEQSL